MGIYTKQNCLDELYKVGQAVDDIKEAIERKGVVVPDNTPLSEYDDLIDSIPTGGDFDNVYDALEGINAGDVKGSHSYFDGSVDVEGLKALGWTEDDIAYFRDNSLHYSWQDSDYIVSEENKALMPWTEENSAFILRYKDNPNIKFHPKLTEDWQISSMSYTGCKYLKALPQFPESFGSITSFTNYFKDCSSLELVPPINTSNGTSFDSMFRECSIKGVPYLDTHNGTSFYYMFYGCPKLTTIPLLDTSNGINFSGMFSSCLALTTIPQLDTHSGNAFSGTFQNCSNLTSVPPLDTSNGTNFSYLFYGCSKLTSVPPLDTHNGTNFNNTFASCNKLQRVEGIDFSGATSALTSGVWPSNNSTITYLRVNGSVNVNWDLSNLKGLDFDSYVSCLEAASRTTNTNAKTLKLYSKSVADQGGQLASLVSQCVSKGWTITGLTLI